MKNLRFPARIIHIFGLILEERKKEIKPIYIISPLLMAFTKKGTFLLDAKIRI